MSERHGSIEFTRNFRLDLERLFAAVSVGPPIAFARFADGEAALLRGEHYRAKSDKWETYGHKVPDLVDGMKNALACELPGWHVGITAMSHHPIDHDYFMNEVAVDLDKISFAELFIFGNWERFRTLIEPLDYCVVGCGADTMGKRGYDIPPDATADPAFDIEPVVGWMLQQTRPILLAAGPVAKWLAFEYWWTTHHLCEYQRNSVIDVGSALSPMLRGRKTRHYHDQEHEDAKVIPVW